MFRPITDEDIVRIEKVLLPTGQHFDEQRRNIIKCQHSVDVNACPGSGKTTVMLAKLLLLTQQMPFKSNQGICVLTHTNVAINEIKEKLGLSDSVLFRYPNHFGTIQSFVNKFLGIPGYISMFPGRRPSFIDQEWYNSVISKRYATWNGAGKIWIRNKPEAVSILQGYKFNSSFDNLLKKVNGEPVFQNNGPAFRDILAFKMRILQDGILSYDDSYALAEYYINRHSRIKDIIGKRFPLLVIDEMQDTDAHQLTLLNQLFDFGLTVVQRIGDYNQAIFNRVSGQSVWAIGAHTMPLTGSMRFSDRIASQIDRICLTPRNMTGNPNIPGIQPRIILFSQANISRVIPHFANLIIEMNITALSEKPCKAVGWVKETEAVDAQVKNCIKSYWQDYSVVNRTIKTEYENMSEYLSKPDEKTLKLKGAVYYWDKLLLIFLKLLRMAQIRNPTGSLYSKTTLVAKLKQHITIYDSLQLNVIKWIRQINANGEVAVEIRNFIEQQFLPLFQIAPSAEINNFLTDQNAPVQQQAGNATDSTNLFRHTYNGINGLHEGKRVNVHVNTIHGVKGETHAATLCLETFYFAEDIKRILSYLKIGHGAPIPAIQVRIIESLKMAYVAMSRPVHFLSLAIRNEDLTAADIIQLEDAGWLVDVSLSN